MWYYKQPIEQGHEFPELLFNAINKEYVKSFIDGKTYEVLSKNGITDEYVFSLN